MPKGVLIKRQSKSNTYPDTLCIHFPLPAKGHWVQTIREIKRLNPDTTVEVLIPDFQGRKELIDMVIEARPEIISHNTVSYTHLDVYKSQMLFRPPVEKTEFIAYRTKQQHAAGRLIGIDYDFILIFHTAEIG